ncbi:MAG: MFS transporter, partial [Gammaproteobacteria bacterium]|nr:MFS transporter [Gammaproteobacteria bacterium]
HRRDNALSPRRAGSVMAVLPFTPALPKPLFGITSDHLNKRLTMGISLCCQIAGLGLIMVVDTQLALSLSAVVFGLGYGAVSPMWSVLLSAMFGREAFARVMGIMSPLTTPFMLGGMPFTTYVYETTGSYLPAFAVLIGGFVVSLTALSLLRLPEERRRESLPEAG